VVLWMKGKQREAQSDLGVTLRVIMALELALQVHRVSQYAPPSKSNHSINKNVGQDAEPTSHMM
jgi:hypothetical protein